MGNMFGFGYQSEISGAMIPSREIWPQNQTFRINGDLYTLFERRGKGKFGSVWASTTPNGRYAAVKVFDLRHLGNDMNSLLLAKSFEDEVKMTYEMRDARNYAVILYGSDFDSQRRVALMAMELGNDSLKDRVQNLHRMHTGYDYISAEDRKNIWVQLVNIILALHQRNVIHRDLRPANLVFFGPTMKVVDFGLAQKGLNISNPNQRSMGVPYYAAPECLTGEAPTTTKADIWSAGAILYYLTYGKKPIYLTSQSPPGVPPTHSILVQDMLQNCLQRNLYQRADHHWLAHHPLTASPAIV